ncbi:MAG: glycosyltransferase family 4 protein [Acidimicrobiales bacterium]|nr:glycosyltransferase family 4 protein [Acidimicrobiales bacterium]
MATDAPRPSGDAGSALPVAAAKTRIGLFTLASGAPMGQQAYEHAVVGRAPAALGPGWEVRPVAVRSLRSPLAGGARLPGRLLGDGPPLLRRVAGRAVYRGVDLVHRFDLRLPPGPPGELLTVHDVAPWRYDDEGSVPRDGARSVRRAACVVCPSQFAADDIVSVLGSANVRVIHNGVDRRFFEAQPLGDEDLARLGVHRPFVLHAGGATRRKNLEGLAAAWPLVRSATAPVELVLVGPADDRRDRHFAGLAGTVRTGRVDDATVTGLVAAAAVVVVPSLYEGFGLPALEAMAARTPVVAARCGALPEVCGDAAYLVEPDGPGLADGILAALRDTAGTAALVARGATRAASFTWEASAAAHADLWKAHAP